MKRRFVTLDVFTRTKCAGNPLAVVLDAEGLDTDEMQAIAREFNLSETVFLLPPADPGHSAVLRIFTPRAELPFAGHPTVGAAVQLAADKYGAPSQAQDAILVLDEAIGPVRVGVRLAPDEPAFAEFDLPKLPEAQGAPPSTDSLCAALGLTHGEIGFENHKPSQWSAGLPFVFVPLRDLQTVRKAEVNLAAWKDSFAGHPAELFVYCRETEHRDNHFHARMFAPTAGILEDPATGSAAAAFAGVIRHFDSLPDGTHVYRVEQGFEMGRPSILNIEISLGNNEMHSARIGGHAVFVSEGHIEI
ncbi:MAG: phenazine biosynthesis protein PhzF [Hyphomicrobiales bacterium]|nr:MAG: phenazine biosynthesis protein PhzF [Hyphomicrobiales bacterium]